jgi:hypothetical protein
MILHAHMSPGGMNNTPIGGRSSDTYSCPINIIIIMKVAVFWVVFL